MSYPVQAADLAIYCINWGFRVPGRGMDAVGREEIEDQFGKWLFDLQFYCKRSLQDEEFESFGIVFVPDPYSPRDEAK